MNIWKLLIDASPGGYQDQQPSVQWLVKICAVFPGNAWTSLRIIGVLPIIWLFAWSAWASFIAFLFFAFTDWIDGKVARFRGEADGVGVWFDPIADKIFILLLFWWFGCIVNNLFVPWLFWSLVIVESAGRLLILLVWKLQGKKVEQENVKAKWWGKVKFGLQITLGIGLFVWFITPAAWWQDFFNGMLWVIMAFAVVSVASHIWEIPEPFHKKS